jgi:AcrR family transcriptional regulator
MSLRERKKHQARQEILRAAHRLIQDGGYTSTRMRDIAAAADVSYQTLYNYFPTKGLILLAILTETADHISTAISTVVAEYNGNLLETLSRINRIRLETIAQGDRELWQIAAIEIFQQNLAAASLYGLIDANAHEVLQLLLSRAREFGELKADLNLPLAADTIFSLAQHNLSRYMLDPSITSEGALDHLHEQLTLLLEPHLN